MQDHLYAATPGQTIEDHPYSLCSRPVDDPVRAQLRKRRRVEARRASNRIRQKTRINIGIAFPRWRSLMRDNDFATDAEFATFLLNSFAKFKVLLQRKSAPDSVVEMEITIEEDGCHSVESNMSDSDDDIQNSSETETETPEQRAHDTCDEEIRVPENPNQRSQEDPPVCDEDVNFPRILRLRSLIDPPVDDDDVYVPQIPNQSSTTSELLLECKEEELEPWQRPPTLVQVKDEDNVGPLENDEGDCKPVLNCKPEPLSLATDAVNSTPPTLKTETAEPVALNTQGFYAHSSQSTDDIKFSGPPGISFQIAQAPNQQLFQEVAPAKETPESQINHQPEPMTGDQDAAAKCTTLCNQLLAIQSSSLTPAQSQLQRCFLIVKLAEVNGFDGFH